jgi:ribosomal protein S18 acetylase RimI-like enzyme
MPETSVEAVFSRPVAECASSEVAAALTRSFEGYLLGPVHVDAEGYERRLRAEHLDPFASRVYLREGPEDDPRSYAGLLLVARRGWTARVAGMGVAPEMRGRGLGERAMREAVGDAQARGDREMVLEVFEQNAPAVALYEKLGFRARRRLFGYRRGAADAVAGTPGALSEADPLEVARLVAREGEPDLPWMLAAETLSAAAPPARAYHLGRHAYALIEEAGSEAVLLSALLVRRPERRVGWGKRLLGALFATFPGRDWYVPAIVPEGPTSTFLESSG